MKKRALKRISTLGVISFLTGYALMAYELVAARILAPTLGGSIYVWTSVIGIIIAALSVGYWVGGKLADARQKQIDVVALCLASGAGVIITILSYASTLEWISVFIDDVRLQGVVASLLLFAPTSFLIGMISPYLAKLNITSLDTAGESVASLSALNSIGGIVGTFTTGFILFSYVGSKESLIIVLLILIVSSWLLVPKQYLRFRIIASVLLLLLALAPQAKPSAQLATIDTPSAHYEILQTNYNNRPIHGLATGPNALQSAVYTDTNSDELVFWYTNYATKLIELQQPKRVLVLGGGAFTVPQVLAQSLPDTEIDAVEIDPALESIAKKYFEYKDQSNVNLIFDDARSFVNTTDEKYDAIFVDVFGSNSTPFSLLTKEYSQKIEHILNKDGLVVVNAIVGLQGKCQELLGAIDATYREFLNTAYWQTESGNAINRGNYILAYTNSNLELKNSMYSLQNQDSTLYTDNFMPAEKLHYQCQQTTQ